MHKKKKDEPISPLVTWGIRAAGIASIIGLLKLHSQFLSKLAFPHESGLVVMFVYAACLLGFSVSAFIELGNIGAFKTNKQLLHYLSYAALAVLFIVFFLGLALILAVLCGARLHSMFPFDRADWYMGLTFGVVTALYLAYKALSHIIRNSSPIRHRKRKHPLQ